MTRPRLQSTRSLPPATHHCAWFLGLLLFGFSAPGCSTFQIPALDFGLGAQSDPTYLSSDGSRLASTMTEQVYRGVQRARSNNAVVLHVVDDEETPVRVLPLPADQRSVYVSDLLQQTGVSQKLGALEAVLYRHTPNTIGGMPMEIRMSGDYRRVRPETDYALRPGDRLQVQKRRTGAALEQLVESVLGI